MLYEVITPKPMLFRADFAVQLNVLPFRVYFFQTTRLKRLEMELPFAENYRIKMVESYNFV